MTTTTNVPAILAGDQRSARFQYRHSVAGAARELGFPASWIWAWLLLIRLESKMRLRKIWVRLDDVQKMFADPEALRDAFFATGEYLTSSEAIQRITQRWPDEHHPYIELPSPGKKPPKSVKADPEVEGDPVVSEEDNSEVVA